METLETAPTPASPDLEVNELEKDLFDYEKNKLYNNKLIEGFSEQEKEAKRNRERRKVDIDIKAERDAGRLKQDETIIIDRVIEKNIAREKPSYIGFIQQSKRLVIFRDVLDPMRKHDQLESNFTAGMQYPNWITPHFRCLDGAQLHGFDWLEYVYDSSKPLHAALEHVGYDRLIFSKDAEDIQNCARVLRVFKLSKGQLDTFVNQFGFNKDQVDILLNRGDGKNGGDAHHLEDKTFTVYKEFCKYEGVVYSAWYAKECTDWLKPKAKHYVGVDIEVTEMVDQPQPITDPITGQPVLDPLTGQVATQIVQVPVKKWVPADETRYPFVILAYEETEDKLVNGKTGRSFKDKFLQEASTAGWSAFVNGNNRAAQVYATAKDIQSLGGKNPASVQNIEIKHGMLTSTPVDFWAPPYPDPALGAMLQQLDIKNANDRGNMTYALNQRGSSARTTKAEVDSAKEDTNLLSSVAVSLYSNHIREAYTEIWRIVQSQALQNKISLIGETTQIVNPVTGEEEYDFQNNMETIKRLYDIRPAGDVDVIQRKELIASMKEFWPIIQNTALAPQFLGKLLRLQFAEEGEAWAAMLQTENQKDGLLVQAAQILTGLLQSPADAMAMNPQQKSNLQQLLMMIQQVLTPPEQNGQQQSNSGSSGGPAQGDSGMVQQPTNQKVLPTAKANNGAVG